MSCPNPIDAAILADYWLAALPQAEEQELEEHLFACDECGTRLREIISLAEAIRKLARQGTLLMVVSDAFLKRVAEEGLHVRQYAPPQGGRIACTVTADDDFLIGRLSADLSQARRVDLSICDAQGSEKLRMTDIPFHPGADSVAFQQPIDYAKSAPSETMIARLVTVDDQGSERVVGEYTFDHTRTLPGPGAW